jgi:hypothetical protein
VQVPALTMVTVLLLTVHTLEVCEEYVTVKLLLAVANGLIANVPPLE